MASPLFVPMVNLNALCDRARPQYLDRRQVTDPGWRQQVRYGIPDADCTPDPDGQVGNVNPAVRIGGVHYRNLWHPDTDKLRLEGPRN